MNRISFLGKGTGFLILLTSFCVIFILTAMITIRSDKKELAGRILFPVFFIELACLFFILAIGFPQKGDRVGPSVVPVLWISAILILSIYMLIRALLGLETKDPPWGNIRTVTVFIGLTILYLILMRYLGYFITTVLYIIFSIRYLNYRKWKVIVPLAAGWVLFSYFAFYRMLYVPLPQGILLEKIFG